MILLLLVDRPAFPPGYCIVNLSAEDPGGFVDLGDRVLIDPRVYVSRQAVIDLGRLFGFEDPDEVWKLRTQLADTKQHLADALQEITTLNRDVEAAEWTLERKFQSKPQPKPGRPRKVTANG